MKYDNVCFMGKGRERASGSVEGKWVITKRQSPYRIGVLDRLFRLQKINKTVSAFTRATSLSFFNQSSPNVKHVRFSINWVSIKERQDRSIACGSLYLLSVTWSSRIITVINLDYIVISRCRIYSIWVSFLGIFFAYCYWNCIN